LTNNGARDDALAVGHVRDESAAQKTKFRVTIASSINLLFYLISTGRRDGSAVERCGRVDILPANSRFDRFNSRLGRRKFPFTPLRELAAKRLICLAILVAERRLSRQNRRNSRFCGNNRELAVGVGVNTLAPDPPG
jgi:hypothetical protein